MTAQDRAIAELRDVSSRALAVVGMRRHADALVSLEDLKLMADAAATLADVMTALKDKP